MQTYLPCGQYCRHATQVRTAEKAAEEFKTDARRLHAVPRR